MSNYCYFGMTISGPTTDLNAIAARIAAGLHDYWTADEFDVPCDLSETLWGKWHDVCIDERSGAAWLWITPHDETTALSRSNEGLRIRGLQKYAPPLHLAERITSLWPKVTIQLHSREEYDFYELWESTNGASHRIGGGDLCYGDEVPWQFTEGKPDPLSLSHHEAPVLTDKAIIKLRTIPVTPRPLPVKAERRVDTATAPSNFDWAG
jgi:hypothetical protein